MFSQSWRTKVLEHPVLGDVDPEYGSSGQKLIAAVDGIKTQLILGNSCQIGLSFGKDSETLFLAFLLAMLELKELGFKPSERSLIVHSDTQVENPSVAQLAKKHWLIMERFRDKFELEFDMLWVEPSFSQSFLGRVVAGRGLPTTVTSSARQCSQELKVQPIKVAVNSHYRKLGKGKKKKRILCLGSRDDESDIRKKSIQKHGGNDDSNKISRNPDGGYVAYFIKTIATNQIWEILTYAGMGKVIPSYVQNYDDTHAVYRDSMGECTMFSTVASEDAKRASCGARHGCFSCLAIGPKDKSLTQMIETGDYDYLKPLHRIREFLAKNHNDWSQRTITNRGIDAYGFTKLQPDLYSFDKCKRLLHALITADAREVRRSTIQRLKLMNGDIEPTEQAIALCEPQFKNVFRDDLILIEFLWSFHSFSDKPWAALEIWHSVYEKELYDDLDDVGGMIYHPNTPQPKPLYVYVGNDWSEGGMNHGLNDTAMELVAVDQEVVHVERTRKCSKTKQTIHYTTMPVCEDKALSVDPEATDFIFMDAEYYLRKQEGYRPLSSAISLLRMGVVSIAKGKASSYHRMAQRQQWYEVRKLNGDVSMESAKARTEELGLLTPAEYRQFKQDNPLPENEVENQITVPASDIADQLEMFDLSILDSDTMFEESTNDSKSTKPLPAGMVRLNEEFYTQLTLV